MTVRPAEASAPRREIRILTAARGIAAWWVVFYHIRGSIPGLPPFVEQAFAKGYWAVDFFFLLSGFVIWLAWHERLRAGGVAAIPAFLLKRFARIWPLHAAMLAVAVALALLLHLTGRSDPDFPWAQLPANILLVQNWGWTDALAWNDPAWSISVELAAYLLFPILVLTTDWRRTGTAALVATMAASFALLGFAMRGEPGLGSDIPHFGIIRCLTEFGAGTIIAALWQRGPARTPVPSFTITALASTAWLIGVPETLAIPLCFAALLHGLALTPMPGGRVARGIHYLGDISYATYLSHFLLWKLFKLVAVRDAAAISPIHIAAYLAAVLIASILLYHGLERPAQRWIETRAERWINRPVRPRVLRSARR